MPVETGLDLENVTVRFGGVSALTDVTLSIQGGSVSAIIGPNGAGKTTLFNVICGYSAPTSGRVLLAGADVTSRSPWERARLGIARTFQRVEIPETLLGWEAISLGAARRARATVIGEFLRSRLARQEEDKFRTRAEEIASLLNLNPWLDVPVGVMPLGVRRRLELGRAMALRPRILLLDEVASGVDVAETQQIAEAIRLVHQSSPLTVVLVEHDVEFVMKLADTVYVLDQGRLIASGAPESIAADESVQRAYLGTVRV
ncbi:MAG: ABC transporter ATP-binding protein [Actinomycetota bacterium]